MRRRDFITGTLGSSIAIGLAAQPGFTGQIDRGTLLALARTVIPDRDPRVWQSGAVAEAFLDEIDGIKGKERVRLESELSSLDAAALESSGKRFAGLGLDERTALVESRLAGREEFRGAFAVVRTAAVNAFYASRTGHERTGYYETTQFIGYPEYLQGAETWE